MSETLYAPVYQCLIISYIDPKPTTNALLLGGQSKGHGKNNKNHPVTVKGKYYRQKFQSTSVDVELVYVRAPFTFNL